MTGAGLKLSVKAPRTAAKTDPDRTPIFASVAYALLGNACSAIRNDNGSPIPQRKVAPRNVIGTASAGKAPILALAAIHVTRIMAIGLPSASPNAVPTRTLEAYGGSKSAKTYTSDFA